MTKDAALLQGQVAKILNERDIVINLGRIQGVKKGMKFAIVASTPEEIFDPKTGEVLDAVDQLKALVQATEVRERITICSTYKTPKISGGIFGALYSFSKLYNSPQEVSETMEDFSLPALLSSDENYIKRGDPVKQVEEPDRV